MSVLDGTDGTDVSAAPSVPPGQPSSVTEASPATAEGDVPARAAGLELIGEMPGSGYREPPSLVRRADGQTLQLTKMLYLVLEAIDGQRTYDEIARVVSNALGRELSGENAHMLVDSKLRPLGVVRLADGSEPEVRKANPLLALRFRWVVSDPAVTRRITYPFAWLFQPLLVAAVLVAFVFVTKWVLFDRGLGYAAHQAFHSPGLLLAVFAVTLVSAGFHEFGHAAAARYGGATPGAMGAGLYLVWPAFYTDVTDSYRLGRGGRLRTDLGGLYFNALLSVVMFGAWWLTGSDALLLVIGTQLIQMVRQLPPMVRFDGYHILADITGVPDLFHRIKPTIVGLWPTNWGKPESKVLKPWAKIVVTVWVLVVLPLMILTVLVTVLTMPRIIASSAASVVQQWHGMLDRFGAGDVPSGLVKVLGLIAVALPIVGIAYMLTRSLRQLTRKVLRSTEGKPGRRALAAALASLVIAGLVFAWWPRGNYHQIEAYERGTIQSLLPASYSTDAAGLAEGHQSSATTIWPPTAGPLPTRDKPALSLVLVPRSDSSAPTWVFPFNMPAPPGIGDNQTLAVNTKNGTVVYDVAFAMVWANQNTVLNKNEAYAFASCSNCRATAVSFQVILIVGQAHVVVPQNISAAVNYNCVSCVTQALALQLVVSLPGNPVPAEAQQLAALWSKIQELSKHVSGMSYNDIYAQLTSYEQQILDIIKKYTPSAVPGSATTTPTSGAPSTAAASSDSGQPTTDSTGATASDTITPSDSGASTAPASSSASSPDSSSASTTPPVESPSGTP